MARPRTLASVAPGGANADARSETRPLALEEATRAELTRRGIDLVTLNRRGRHGVDLAIKQGSSYRILTIRVSQELESMLEIDDRLFDEIVGALDRLTARAG